MYSSRSLLPYSRSLLPYSRCPVTGVTGGWLVHVQQILVEQVCKWIYCKAKTRKKEKKEKKICTANPCRAGMHVVYIESLAYKMYAHAQTSQNISRSLLPYSRSLLPYSRCCLTRSKRGLVAHQHAVVHCIVSKEAYIGVKKRPILVSKEAHISVKRGLC